MHRSFALRILLCATSLLSTSSLTSVEAQDNAADRGDNQREISVVQQFVRTHCLDCHDSGTQEAELDLEFALEQAIPASAPLWEKVVRKLTARQMPPSDYGRPDEAAYGHTVAWLEEQLDAAAAEVPQPGRTETFRRLNRTEYRNAVRDLLGIEVDVTDLLPSDQSSHGFDNITVSGLSPVLLDRYVSAATKISKLAVAANPGQRVEKTYRIRPDVTQDSHIPGTPIGSRGGGVIRHYFPYAGTYRVQVHLMRDRNEELEGLHSPHELEILLDRQPISTLRIEPPPRGSSDRLVDADLTAEFQVEAGTHEVATVFVPQSNSLLETIRQPLNVHFNYYRHPRLGPAVYQVTVSGPFGAAQAENTPSREQLFICEPRPGDEDACAEKILTHLVRRAYRREVGPDDLEVPLAFYREGSGEAGFDAGIEAALSAVLVNPNFLFRIEREPSDLEPGTAYQLSPTELASRLSFFLWSSLPDEELLNLAIAGKLTQPEVWEAQVQRLLADERSESLVSNFAGQWLYLRNLDAVIPDMRLFPDFDHNLRQALRKETELLLLEILREDRSVLDLIRADHTYLNERLAKHYEVPHVYGSRFRRVPVDESSRRGGLLRHGSILTVTSYATRTSPVIRGSWILENLLGTPPPPPPPDVPALEDNTVAANLTVRERLEQHRANESCAVCHNLIDPVGFSLENYDAVGRWRDSDAGEELLAEGGLPDGSQFQGVAGLEEALLKRPELFVRTLTEKLLTFALGRGIEHYDAPAVRRIVDQAEANDYRFSDLILGIVNSVPFQMRNSK